MVRAVNRPPSFQPKRCRRICCDRKMMEAVQASRDRGAIYQYLSAVFETVAWWAKEGKAVKRAHRALHLQGHKTIGSRSRLPL